MKALYTGVLMLLTLCLAAQQEATFTVKKPKPFTDESKLSADTFFINQFTFAGGTVSDGVKPAFPDFLAGIDSMFTGDALAKDVSSYCTLFDSMSVMNLQVGFLGKYLLVKAPAKPCGSGIMFWKKQEDETYRLVYYHQLDVVPRRTAGM